MEKLHQHTPESKEEFEFYMAAQVMAIRFGIKIGLVLNAAEWVEKYAEPFRMMMFGELEIPSDLDWMKLREETKQLINKNNDGKVRNVA